jgi:hypothetical protein
MHRAEDRIVAALSEGIRALGGRAFRMLHPDLLVFLPEDWEDAWQCEHGIGLDVKVDNDILQRAQMLTLLDLAELMPVYVAHFSTSSGTLWWSHDVRCIHKYLGHVPYVFLEGMEEMPFQCSLGGCNERYPGDLAELIQKALIASGWVTHGDETGESSS